MQAFWGGWCDQRFEMCGRAGAEEFLFSLDSKARVRLAAESASAIAGPALLS